MVVLSVLCGVTGNCIMLICQIVDLFSSLDRQPMCIQVAVIDALEDFVLEWLCKHNLPWYVLSAEISTTYTCVRLCVCV